MMSSPPLLSVLLLLLVLYSCPEAGVAQPLSSPTEEAALYQLRSSLGLRAADWPRKADPCTSWAGVRCSSGRVVALDLSGLRRTRLARLRPRFDVDGIGNLTSLAAFNASGFPLPGPIPDALTGAAALSVVSLAGCSVTGAIPPSIARLTNLAYLDLSSNNISGILPPALGALRNLSTLVLTNNSLSGAVTAELGNLSSLVALDLSFNSISGSLPESLFLGLSGLQSLKLNHNNISSALPDSLWRLPDLTFLDVSVNNLTGEFPAVASSNGNANGSVFNLSGNFYYGQIPSGFGVLQRFRSVDLSGNYFEGDIVFDGLPQSALVAVNCFSNASNQRSSAECEEFYKEKGIAYTGSAATNGGKSNHIWKYILAGVLGGTALMVILFVVFFLCLRKCMAPAGNQRASTSNGVPSGVVAPMPASPTAPVNMSAVGDAFTYDQLLKATSGFSNTNLIKNGHSGDLYHGVLENGTQVVVKKVDLQAVRKEAHAAELNFFAKHPSARIVPFLGHCLENENENENEKLLIYKYMPNGDLSSALHKKSEQEDEGFRSLDWITRLKIAVGVTEALCYLHENNPPLVHRDIQASSILLDHKYEVRLGSLTEVCPQQVDGHPNVLTRILRSSAKSEQGASGSSTANGAYDVYCLGKVLLELVTGKLGISGSNGVATSEWLENTLSYISVHDKELITTIVDPALTVNEDHLEEAWAMAIVAKSCLNLRPSKRPPAKHILKALENPSKLVRQDSSSSARLRPTSSRGSWHGAFVGSRRNSISDINSLGPTRDARSLRHSATSRSQGSGAEGPISQRRMSREIFPEPELPEDMP